MTIAPTKARGNGGVHQDMDSELRLSNWLTQECAGGIVGAMRISRRHWRDLLELRRIWRAQTVICLFLLLCGARFVDAAEAPQLKIGSSAGGIRLEITGEAGTSYALESATDLQNWRPFASWNQVGPVQEWLERAVSPYHFFRARIADPEPPFVFNFRLTDQFDRSHELYYDTTSRAVVVVFLDFNCSETAAALSSVASLQQRFGGRGVRFWIVDATGDAGRTQLKERSISMNIDLPVLHDRGRLVTRGFDVRNTPEAWVVNTESWSLVYRGRVGGQGDEVAPSGDGYLANALDQFLGNQAIHFSQTPTVGCEVAVGARATPVYSEEIVPLLQAKCIGCHSPGNIAPWSMTNHAIIKTYAASIKDQVLSGSMPPWHADPQYGDFSNDASLKPEEAAALVQWINAGAPRGDGPDPLESLSAPQGYPFDWPAELGEPDVVLTIPKQEVRAFGEEPYHYVNVPTSLDSDVWIRAAVIVPGNVRVVHHCLVYFGANSFLRGLDGFFAGYVPGTAATAYPQDTGKLLPKGASLQFQMHYTTTGEPETDTTRIGIYLHKEKPKYELKTRSAYKVFFTIPPGAPDYEVDAQYSFSSDAWLFELSPHMHYRGSRFRYEAVYPDGTREVLLNVPKYEFDWQTLYRFAEPKFMPAGSKLVCVGAWDNSAQNPHNPDPNASIRFGEQTDDEMFIGYFNFAEAK